MWFKINDKLTHNAQKKEIPLYGLVSGYTVQRIFWTQIKKKKSR